VTSVAWLHNVVGSGGALLSGEYAGGGEMADAGMIAHAPYGVEVTRIAASQWEQALGFDRIVIAATDQLPDEAMMTLAERQPIVWVHHEQQPSRARAHLFRSASPFVCMSTEHALREAAWSDARPVWNHGWIDPDDVTPADKNGRALWAARNHPQKGRIGARIWAQRHGVELTEVTDAPRADVLAAMSTHTYFVFLPKAFDSCPRTLIEAELAGCEIATNHLAGRRDPGDIREVLAAQPGKFWGWL
jgi:hypothetical protein